LGIDLQQVSIASLIIALGLLVDVPVVSGDGIKRHLAEGFQRSMACWLGPTKLATAIFYATITNVIAYLPFLMLTGNTGEFLKSLPVVMTASLLCAYLCAMTFVPFLSYYILRAPTKREPTIEEMRQRGFYGFYNKLVGGAIKNRWAVLGGSLVFLIAGGLFAFASVIACTDKMEVEQDRTYTSVTIHRVDTTGLPTSVLLSVEVGLR